MAAPAGRAEGPPRERQGRGRPFPPCPGQGGGAAGAAGWWPALSAPGKAKPQRRRSLGSPGAGGRRRRLSGARARAAPHAARAAGSALAAAALVVVCVGGLAAAGSPPWGGRAGAAEEEAVAAAGERRPGGPMEEREGEVRWDALCSRDAAARGAALDTIGQSVLRRADSIASGAAARDGLGEALARLLMLSKRCPFPDVREKSEAILSGVQVSAAASGTRPGALPAPSHPGAFGFHLCPEVGV